MGQKVNPISMRLQVNKDWRSKWFASKRDYANYLSKDLSVRKMIRSSIGSRALASSGRTNKIPIFLVY